MEWNLAGWVMLSLSLLLLLSGAGLWLFAQKEHRAGAAARRYLVDRLELLQKDLERAAEDLRVLTEAVRRKGLLDEDDIAALRREIIERPRQRQAEQAELLRAAPPAKSDQVVLPDSPETLH